MISCRRSCVHKYVEKPEFIFLIVAPLCLIWSYLYTFCRGINYLHENKPEAIIHRDLEPEYVIIVFLTVYPWPVSCFVCSLVAEAWQMYGKLLISEWNDRNILRDDSGLLKVADFGLSKLMKFTKTVREVRPLARQEDSCECIPAFSAVEEIYSL